MVKKIFSLPKRYWVMAHVLELVIGFLVLTILHPHAGIGILPWYEMLMSYGATLVLFVGISVALFPISFFIIHIFNDTFEVLPEYVAIVSVVVPFVIYYALWLIPDHKWSERQLSIVSRIRIIWFLAASVAAWVVVFQPM